MKSIRKYVAFPFVLIGTIFAWIGLALVRLGYVIGGGPYESQFDPLELFDDGRKYSPD
jgi:hypothetical protein